LTGNAENPPSILSIYDRLNISLPLKLGREGIGYRVYMFDILAGYAYWIQPLYPIVYIDQ